MRPFRMFAGAQRMAVRNLTKQKTRSLVMTGILALVVAAFMIVVPILEAMARDAAAKTSPMQMPCDLALLIAHSITYTEPNLANPKDTKVMSLCPAATDHPLPWNSLKGFESVQFVTLEKAYTPAGLMDVLFGDPDADWFSRSISIEKGRAPESAREAIIPGWFAQKSALGLEDSLTLMFSADPLHRFRHAEYRVVGIFSTEFLQADFPLVYGPAQHQHRLTDLVEYSERGAGARLLALFDLGGNTPGIPAVRRMLTDAFADAGRKIAPEAKYSLDIIAGFTPQTPALMARALAQDVQMPAVNALFLAFVFVAIGLFTVMLMSFLDRRRDIAIMKTLGITNDEVAAIFAAEVAMVAVVGISLGLAVSVRLVKSLSGTALAPVLALRWPNALKASIAGLSVVGLSAVFPVSLARIATVNQLLNDQRIYLFHRKVIPAKKEWRRRY